MGPMTNVLFACATAVWWKPLVSFFGSPAVYLWLTVNLFLAALALYPQHVRDINYLVPSDGLALLQLPRRPRKELEVYLYSASLLRALSRYEDGDFVGALSLATKALARAPKIVALQLTQAASYLSNGDYQSGIDIVRPLLSGSGPQEANVRAALQINLAFGLVMSNIGLSADNPQLQEADRQSRDALKTYPCVLEYRCTRALVLAVTGRAEEALQILDYDHFDTGTRRQRAQRQAARAFALRMLNASQEAEEAAALAVQLDPAILRIVQSLGFSPKPGAKLIEPRRGKPIVVAVAEELEPLSAGGTALARIAGVVLLVFGGALGALSSLGGFRQVESLPIVHWKAVVTILVLGLLSIFCLAVGYRLARNRPNHHGSMLPPSAWIALAGLFGAAGLGLLATAITAKVPLRGTLAPALGSLVFAALCWRMRAATVKPSM
jgi:tetratricopeptide (TPR) repeat protein